MRLKGILLAGLCALGPAAVHAQSADALAWLRSLGVEPHVVATKVDKLTRAERARNLKTAQAALGTAVMAVSAATGEGLDELWRLIAQLARRT